MSDALQIKSIKIKKNHNFSTTEHGFLLQQQQQKNACFFIDCEMHSRKHRFMINVLNDLMVQWRLDFFCLYLS